MKRLAYWLKAACLTLAIYPVFGNYIYSQPLPAKNEQKGFAVLELFTSQGDINSPAADSILSSIHYDSAWRDKNVICIAMHVDFWNRFGWKDPYSSFRFTNRLNNYVSVFGDKEVFTPYLLINGNIKTDATQKSKINSIINKELSKTPQYHPELTFAIFNDTLELSYNMNAPVVKKKSGGSNYLNVAITESGISTKILKGDNAGKTLRNDNVTRLFHTETLNETRGTVKIPLKGLKPAINRKIIVFVQDKKTRKITGANAIPFNK